MKKAYKFIMAFLILILTFSSMAFADSGRVVDETDLLNKEEKSAMETRLGNLADKYDFDILVIISDESDAKKNAEDFVSGQNYGDGIVLSFQSERGDFYILPFGEGAEFFDTETVQQIHDEVRSYIEKEKVYEGLNVYIRQTEKRLEGVKDGAKDMPADYKARSRQRIIIIALALIIGIFAAMGVTYSMKKSMEEKNVFRKDVFSDSVLKITGREDIYLKTEEEEL